MVGRGMPKYGHGGPHGTPFMTIFGIYVSIHIPNIEKIKYVRCTNPGRYLIFLLIKFPIEWHQNHVWGTIFDPNYDHIYKCDYFGYI